MKMLLAILMVLCLMLARFSGCGGTSGASAEAASEPASETVASEPAPVEEAPEEAPAAEPSAVEEPSVVEEPVEEIPELPTISYPLGEGLELVLWTDFDNNAFGSVGLSSYNDLQALDLVEVATGVRYVYNEVSFFSAAEQFNLMIASGDWPDIMKAGRYYTGGLAQALSDDVILDLSDMLMENAPDYYAALEASNQTTKDSIRTDGKDLMMVSLLNEYVNDGGAFTRGDWLEELGVEWPDTFDGFVDLLYQVKDTYGGSHTYPADPGAGMSGAEAYFGSALFSIRSDTTDLAIYVDDGTVCSGAISDGYREYLTLAAQLYADGIFNQDFYVSELGRGDTMGYIGSGDIFIWTGRADTMNDPLYYTDDPDMWVKPVTTYFPGESGVYDFMDEIVYANTEGLSITTACLDPEMALNFFNWFFTEEGQKVANYGIEGVSYNMDANGEVQYTDLILNNPDGMNFNLAIAIYSVSGVVTLTDNTAKLAAYTDEVVEAINLFSSLEGTSTDHTYPNGAALDAVESDSIANQLTAVCSYAAEQCLKFVVGSEPLNDETWNAYVENCIGLGIEDCVAVYQQAYDDYVGA